MDNRPNLILKEVTAKDDYQTAISGDFFTPLSQTWSYGQWQKAAHRNTRNFLIQTELETLGGFQLLQYPLPFKLNYLYVPHGPILKKNSPKMKKKNF